MSRKNLSSRSSVVCRYLLYSMAKDIGSCTLEVVRFLTPYHITNCECYELDDIIVSGKFPHEDIEKAAYITLNFNTVTFFNLKTILCNLKKSNYPAAFLQGSYSGNQQIKLL